MIQNCYPSDISQIKLTLFIIRLFEWRMDGTRRGKKFTANFDRNTWKEGDYLGDVDIYGVLHK
jgi:hypothetical protein